MKKYENVELELVELACTDVITTSGEDEDDNSIPEVDWDE